MAYKHPNVSPFTTTPTDVKKFIENSTSNIFMKISLNIAIPILLMSFMYLTYLDWYTSTIYTFVSYITESLSFLGGHINIHQQFIEMRDGKVDQVSSFVHLAYLHHYSNPVIFYEMDYTYYIFSYFESNKPIKKNSVFRNVSLLSKPITYIEFFMLFISLITSVWYGFDLYTILLCIFWSRYFKLMRLTQLSIMLLISYFFEYKHLAYILIYFPLMLLLNSMLHLWYHVPKRHRKSYLCFSYPFFQCLETLGLISTKHHKKHHEHRLNNIEETIIWTDLPQFVLEDYLESLCNKVFQSKRMGIFYLSLFYISLSLFPMIILQS